MALWSGQDSIQSAIADLISRNITEQDIVNILDQLIGPQIGEIKYSTCPVGMRSKSESGNITKPDDLPDDFDGWIRANGIMIARDMFPEMAQTLDGISDYPGKASSPDGKLVAVPNLTDMIRLNPCTNTEQPFEYSPCEYSTPAHTHMLGNIQQQTSQDVKTIKRAAWIWSSAVGTGKAQAQTWHGIQIPAAPAVHRGAGKFYHNVTWDIPVETRYNKNEIQFKGDTGLTGYDSKECYPSRVIMPVQIFIGKYK